MHPPSRDACASEREAGKPKCNEDDRRRAAEAVCRLTSLIAVSRHARVYRATVGNRSVVLKIIAGEADPTRQALFEREGRIGHTLQHPSLTRTLRFGAKWILLDDLHGSPDVSRETEARERPVAGLAGVADALAYIHARGLVHRDVKPGNILYGQNGEAVLIDLGLIGLAAGDDLGRDEVIGSPAWMAPEQMAGRQPRPEADVWSFSLVLACGLCGFTAFEGSADAVLRHRSSGGGPVEGFMQHFDGLPATPLKEFVMAGLAEDPASRPPMGTFARLLGERHAECLIPA